MADAIERARAHQAVIDDLWDYADPALSEGRFRAAADAATDSIDRDILQTQLARALGLQGKFDDGRAVLDAISADDAEVGVRVWLERGRVLNTSGDSDGAMLLFGEAFGPAAEAGFEFLTIDAVHMLAIVAPADAQDAFNGQALQLAEMARDPRARRWRGSLLNNMGWTAFDRGDLDAALGRFKAALAARQEAGTASEILTARWCIARTLREMGRADEALAIQVELAEAHKAAGTSDPYVDEEIAACRADLASAGQSNTTPDPGSG